MDFVAVVAFAAAVLAQTPEVTAGNALFAYGPMGVIICWFMFRGEAVLKEIRGLSNRIDGLTKAMLVDVLSRDNGGMHTQTQSIAQEMLSKIQARDDKTRGAES